MPDLQKAIAEAKQQQDLAALVAQLVAQLPAAAPAAGTACGCQHHQAPAPAPSRSLPVRPLAIGGAVLAGGAVLTTLALAVAVASVAVTVSVLVAYLLVREVRKGGAR